MAKFGFRNHLRCLDFSSVPSFPSRSSPEQIPLVKITAVVMGEDRRNVEKIGWGEVSKSKTSRNFIGSMS